MPSHPQYVPDLCTGLSTRAGTLRGHARDSFTTMPANVHTIIHRCGAPA